MAPLFQFETTLKSYPSSRALCRMGWGLSCIQGQLHLGSASHSTQSRLYYRSGLTGLTNKPSACSSVFQNLFPGNPIQDTIWLHIYLPQMWIWKYRGRTRNDSKLEIQFWDDSVQNWGVSMESLIPIGSRTKSKHLRLSIAHNQH